MQHLRIDPENMKGALERPTPVLNRRVLRSPTGVVFTCIQPLDADRQEKASSLVKVQNAGRIRIDGHDRHVEAGDLLLLPADAVAPPAPGMDVWTFIALAWIVFTAWLLFV